MVRFAPLYAPYLHTQTRHEDRAVTKTLPHALVLTARPGSAAIGNEAIARASTLLSEGRAIEPRWLCPSEAWEALFQADEAAPPRMLARIRTSLAGLQIDANLVPADPAHRRRRLIVADMESTVIEQEMLDELAGEIGLRETVSGVTERAMRGELDFETELKERVALLAGLDADVLDRLAAERITLMPGARALLATMKANGAFAALVSGGFTVFTGPVARELGFDVHHANTLEVRDGRLTGQVVPPILGREAKLAALQRYTAARGLEPADTLAVGDGANDVAMIKAAGLGVAFRAKPALAAEAAARIEHGDLTALLYLQGYSREEFRD
jgi:phosphoserine phosphatase